jgi:hypothetical protein
MEGMCISITARAFLAEGFPDAPMVTITIDFLMGVQIISSIQPCGEDGALQPRLAFLM